MRRFVIYCQISVFVTTLTLIGVGCIISDYETSNTFYPVKVTKDGKFLSHFLQTYHNGDNVHFNISLNDEDHLLELEPYSSFLGPSLIVERRGSSNHTRTKLKSQHTNCHFRGKVRGKETSSVAISTCNGLAGLIQIGTESFYIEPMEKPKNDVSYRVGQKHKITKRSYGTKRPKRRKRKRKKRRSTNNCGTKDRKKVKRIKKKPKSAKHENLDDKYSTLKFGSDEYQHNSLIKKKKRSLSEPHYVEVLVVADTSMVVFHEEWDLSTYLLTIMNMVSMLYMDPSIGNLIHIVVVKIIVIEESTAEPELIIVPDSDKTLKNFCKWQKNINPTNDSHPHHHDVAVLVTRKDICSFSSSGCNTLGVAQVGSICSSEQNCNVNEDNGISLAHTIAHEIGHNLGMYHDSERLGCGDVQQVQYIMTPSFQADMIGVTWSKCSRRDVTNFLDRGLGHCLHDEPTQTITNGHSGLPAGAIYDAAYQCKLLFASDATECSPEDEICFRLWCQVNETCTTKLLPAAPGTTCGKHKWCQNLRCVDIMDPPVPVNGGWGEWSSWSECSRTCGAGVSISERKCDHPEPIAGGNFCIGLRKRYKMCNTDPCPEYASSFREKQCEFYNNNLYEGKKYTWHPYFESTEPCKLYCIDANNSMVMPLGNYAQDGTPCNIGTRDVCIDGICHKVGCDWIVGSNNTEDECGICEGDNSKCNIFNGTYTKQGKSPGYREIVVIPAGARNIKIIERRDSDNYISVSSILKKKYYLNGKKQNSLPGELSIAGSSAMYERTSLAEKLRIPGPIQEPIVVLVVFVGNTFNPGIDYQYSMFKPDLYKETRYSWSYSEWTQCSATCGGGIQESSPVCKESIASSDQYVLDGISTIVDEFYCEPSLRPKEKMRTCNDWMCHSHWWIGPWQSCPVTCKDKGIPLRKRSVMCVDGQEMALPDNFCDGKTKPVEYKPCGTLPACN